MAFAALCVPGRSRRGNCFGIQLVSTDNGANDVGGHICRVLVREPPTAFADRRANRINNISFSHLINLTLNQKIKLPALRWGFSQGLPVAVRAFLVPRARDWSCGQSPWRTKDWALTTMLSTESRRGSRHSAAQLSAPRTSSCA